MNHKHGGATGRRTSEYHTWRCAKRRCYNPNDPAYPYYGGRGIRFSDEWRDSFAAFLRDMGARPSPGLTLDRIDSNGNYEHGNCRWATRSVQSANCRKRVATSRGAPTSRYIGVRKTSKGWQAHVRHKSVYTNIGTFDAEEQAACERDAHVVRHGLPHRLNFQESRKP